MSSLLSKYISPQYLEDQMAMKDQKLDVRALFSDYAYKELLHYEKENDDFWYSPSPLEIPAPPFVWLKPKTQKKLVNEARSMARKDLKKLRIFALENKKVLHKEYYQKYKISTKIFRGLYELSHEDVKKSLDINFY